MAMLNNQRVYIYYTNIYICLCDNDYQQYDYPLHDINVCIYIYVYDI
jgi:hypothetical protein